MSVANDKPNTTANAENGVAGESTSGEDATGNEPKASAGNVETTPGITFEGKPLTEYIAEQTRIAVEADREARRQAEETERAKRDGDLAAQLKLAEEATERERVAREKAETLAHEKDVELWKAQALATHTLDNSWANTLVGNTKEEILESAKQRRKQLDDAIKAAGKETVRNSDGTPPTVGGTGNETGKDFTEKVGKTIRDAFGISALPIR